MTLLCWEGFMPMSRESKGFDKNTLWNSPTEILVGSDRHIYTFCWGQSTLPKFRRRKNYTKKEQCFPSFSWPRERSWLREWGEITRYYWVSLFTRYRRPHWLLKSTLDHLVNNALTLSHVSCLTHSLHNWTCICVCVLVIAFPSISKHLGRNNTGKKELTQALDEDLVCFYMGRHQTLIQF